MIDIKWDKEFNELNIENFTNRLRNTGVDKLIELGNFHFNILMNIPINFVKENPTIYLQFEFINWILSLPQLKADELLKYKVYVVPLEENQEIIHTPFLCDLTERKECYNYVEVFTHTMNYQLNQIKDVWSKCDYINVKVCVNSLRALVSTAPDETLDLKTKIVGLQAIIDNMYFSTKIYKKPLSLKKFSQLKRKKLMRWATKENYGKIKFIYASFYDGYNLLDIKPPSLYNKRKLQFNESINNPINFSNFFNIKTKINNSNETLNNLHFKDRNRITYSDYIINSLFHDYVILENPERQQITKNDNMIPEQEINDLEFHPDRIFLKIDSINFEKHKKLQLTDYLAIKNQFLPHKEIEVSQFCYVKGFKIVLSNLLKDLLVSMISKTLSKLQKIKPKSKKSQSRQLFKSSSSKKNDFSYKLKPKVVPNTIYTLAFLIEGPEFNIYDECTDTQVLCASEAKSICLIYQEILPFDNMEIDPKINIKMIFNDLQLFTAPSYIDYANRCFWLDDTKDLLFSVDKPNNDNNNIRKGVLNRIMKTDYSLFHFHFFKQSKMFIDFTQPIDS